MRSDEAIRRQCHERWRVAATASRKWRKEAREDFEFYAGRQWDEQDAAFLKERQRPLVTFNRCAPFIDGVAGTEVNNRQETTYLPRTVNPNDLDGLAAETFTDGARWIRQECDADDHESDAYLDALITGMGWTETRIDYEDEQDGKVLIERVPPLEMYWAAGSDKPNLSDADDIWRVRMISVEEVRNMFPGKKINWAGTDMYADLDIEDTPVISNDVSDYELDQGNDVERQRGRVKVIQYQWREREGYYRTVDPETGEDRQLATDMVDSFRAEAGEDYPVTRQTRRRYYQAFIVGKTVLEKKELFLGKSGDICPGFSFKCITGKRDEVEKTWFGLMRASKDPQRWANKFFSQIQDVINSNAKGGILAETDAFENQRQAEENWAKPDAIVWASPGALAAGKIIDRKPAQYPTGLDRLMQVSIDAIPMVTGVSYEMLGITGTNQPNVLERTRIGRSLTVLAKFASSLRGYRKGQGRLLLHLMRNFVSPETLSRATGKDVSQILDSDVARFDVAVDQSPTSPNIKEDVWFTLVQGGVLKLMLDAGIPFPKALFKFLPFPESLNRELQAEMSQPDPMMEQSKQLQVAQQAADVEKTKMDAQSGMIKAMSADMGAKTNLLQAVDEIMSPPEPAKSSGGGSFPKK